MLKTQQSCHCGAGEQGRFGPSPKGLGMEGEGAGSNPMDRIQGLGWKSCLGTNFFFFHG